ncbi:MAG: hypothetical protein AAGF07_01945 [Patescibacteria group bacterium]
MLEPLSLKQGLQKTTKKNLWKEALLYSILVETTHHDLSREYPDFTEEFKQLKVFYNNQPQELTVKIISSNIHFITWLKTEYSSVENYFLKKLSSKKLIHTNQAFTLKCLSR